MCFSAQASFAASAGLLALGSYALARHHSKKSWMMACIPLFFGIQQAAEGVVWLTQTGHISYPLTSSLAPYMFLFFAFFIWPLWMPTAVEKFDGSHVLTPPLQLIGAGTALLLAFFTLSNGVTVSSYHHHITYSVDYPLWLYWPLGIGYVLAVVLPFFLASERLLPLFGAAVFSACVISYTAFYMAFTSVWCFFAALLSFFVLVILRRG
jgi:hypothetical protein